MDEIRYWPGQYYLVSDSGEQMRSAELLWLQFMEADCALYEAEKNKICM